jgi:Bacterial pre-peptidase C-terminal domain
MRPCALGSFGFVLIGMWTASAVHGQPSPTLEPTRTDVVIEERLAPADPADRIRKVPGKTHVVELKKGKNYRIDMMSTEIDSSLRLEDESGKTLAQDEDSGGGLNARIDFRPPADGRYRIQATTYAGGVGKYTITVKELALVAKSVPRPPKLGGPVPAAVKATFPADKKPLVHDGKLKLDDPRDPVMGQSAQVFEIELEANQLYRFDLRSKQFDAYLRLIDAKENELARDDDSGGDLNARIVFRPTTRGLYRIIATSFNGTVGVYSLTITPEVGPKPEKFVAGKVRKIEKGLSVIDGEIAASDPKDRSKKQSFCHVHEFELSPAKSYTVDLTSSKFDAYLRLEDPTGKQLAEDDDSGGGTNSRIFFRPRIPGVYRIIATTFEPNSVGAYSLTIREE